MRFSKKTVARTPSNRIAPLSERKVSQKWKDKFLSGEDELVDGGVLSTPQSDESLRCDAYLNILGFDAILNFFCSTTDDQLERVSDENKIFKVALPIAESS
jgi:hypothetical protein